MTQTWGSYSYIGRFSLRHSGSRHGVELLYHFSTELHSDNHLQLSAII